MTPVAELTHSLSVAGQIQPEDVQALAKDGYRVIICNRPDNEEPNQPSMDAIAAACELASIQFVRYPVDAMSFPGDDLDAMDETMNGDEKVLAYCRSGARSTPHNLPQPRFDGPRARAGNARHGAWLPVPGRRCRSSGAPVI